MTRHCRGMNVPRIEDRGLWNSMLDFHSSFARLKNFMPNFIFHISIIVSERKNSSSIKLSSKSFFLFFNNHRISSLKKRKEEEKEIGNKLSSLRLKTLKYTILPLYPQFLWTILSDQAFETCPPWLEISLFIPFLSPDSLITYKDRGRANRPGSQLDAG